MTTPTSHAMATDQPDPADDERRSRAGLRALVDQMMAQIRDAASHDTWTEEERERAEADLLRIMAQVRAEAMGQRNGAHG